MNEFIHLGTILINTKYIREILIKESTYEIYYHNNNCGTPNYTIKKQTIAYNKMTEWLKKIE